MSDKRTGKKMKADHQPKTPMDGAAVAADPEAIKNSAKGAKVRTPR